MRRLPRRLCERTRLKSITSLLVGIGLATNVGSALSATMLEPGSTTHLNQLSSETPLEIGPGHTLVLDTDGTFFGLDAPLINRGVVHLLNTSPLDARVFAFSVLPQVNRGQWIVDQRIEYFMEGGLDNQGGVLQIGAYSTVYATNKSISGGRIHGTAHTSALVTTSLKDVTVSGTLNLLPWQQILGNSTPAMVSGTLTVEGTLGIGAMHLGDSTFLRGAGTTVLQRATVSATPGNTARRLTVESDHTLSGTGELINVSLINQGTIENQKGEHLVSNQAIVQEGENAQLVVNGLLEAPSIHVEGGSIDIGYTGTVIGDVLLQQGRLILHNFTGAGQDDGQLEAAISGDLTLNERSLLEVVVGPGYPFAILTVYGRASLDGELVVSFAEGAQVPSSFDLLVSGNDVQGSFRSLHVNGSGNLPWTFVLNSHGRVSIAAVPEPGTLGLILCGLGVVGWRVRRRAALHPTH